MSRTPRRCGRPWTCTVAMISLSMIMFAADLADPVRLHAAARGAFPEDAPNVRRIVVTLNKSRNIRFEKPITRATIGAPDIADINPLSKTLIYVLGKKIGTTNISIFDQNNELLEVLDLEVAVDTKTLQQKIRTITGSNSIQVSTSNGEVVLSGTAANAIAADRAVSMAKSIVKTDQIINAINVASSQQVLLKVRFLEVSRTSERDLGVNWFATTGGGTRGVSTGLGFPVTIPGDTSTGRISILKTAGTLLSSSTGEPFGVVLANLVNGGTNIDVLISALEKKGVVRRLAEPNLVALSGDTARFLAGGEFPVPTAVSTTSGAGVTPTISFKKFGVSLAFVPTVLNSGVINLRIAPEVSEPDFTNTVTISGTSIPSLITRNAQTTIELRDGQSFAIAGLLQSNGVRNISQIPWVGSLPILGALFRSTTFQKNESDLVIIVSPHLVSPATPADHLATPLDRRLPSNDVDLFVNGQPEVPKVYTNYVASGGDLHGPYGYIIAVENNSDDPTSDGDVAK